MLLKGASVTVLIILKDVAGKEVGKWVKKVFPDDIHRALLKTLQNPAASSCADIPLLRVLRRYDDQTDGSTFVETLPEGALFTIRGGKLFKKMERIRKRIRCVEVATGKVYLFSPVYEVVPAGA